MHGSGGNRSRVAHHARMLSRNGYGVLLFDQRGHGDSAGHGNMLGWNAAQDVDAAVDLLERTPGVEHIAADGISMGGEVLLAAAARDQRIEAVVTDGAEQMNDDDNPLLVEALQAVSGERRLDVARVVGDIAPRPALLISAGHRGGEPQSNAMFQRRIGRSATHWSIGDVGHTAGLREHPREYERRVIGFLDRAMMDR
jgi:pimeloyl-ACP methyl ester carboxylesterase